MKLRREMVMERLLVVETEDSFVELWVYSRGYFFVWPVREFVTLKLPSPLATTLK